MKNDFIKEEIRIEIEETLNGLNVDANDVFDSIVNDELFLDMLTLSIYTAIEEQLKEKNIKNENIEDTIAKIERNIVSSLMNRGII